MIYYIYLTSWGKEIKCEASRAFYRFFAMISIIQDMDVVFYFSYDIERTLESHFCVNVKILPHVYATLLWSSFHNATKYM